MREYNKKDATLYGNMFKVSLSVTPRFSDIKSISLIFNNFSFNRFYQLLLLSDF